MKLQGVYHDFAADKGGASYGTEVDLLASRKFGKSYTLLAKYASYSADTFATDTSKMWLMGQAQFQRDLFSTCCFGATDVPPHFFVFPSVLTSRIPRNRTRVSS